MRWLHDAVTMHARLARVSVTPMHMKTPALGPAFFVSDDCAMRVTSSAPSR